MPVVFVAASQLPTPFGVFTMHGFLETASGKEHVALTYGDVADGEPVLGRLHSECLTGDALFSLRCDCGFQLEAALRAIASEGRSAEELMLEVETWIESEMHRLDPEAYPVATGL